MSEGMKTPFVGYEYKEISVPSDHASMYVDCYECFGWETDENFNLTTSVGATTVRLKRDRKIVNKMELTRLQRNFEACAKEVGELERSKTSVATVLALVIGIIGTAFMAGAVFAVTSVQPVYWLSIVLAIPAFIGWIIPYYVYRFKVRTTTQKVQPIIEAKIEEIYEICEKGHALL